MKYTITLMFIVAVLLVGISALAGAADDHPGKALFLKEKCNTCHAVESQGIEATRGDDKAPDMSNIGDVIPDAEWATKFVKREETKDGKKHRRPYKGTDADLERIVEWLLTLKAS